MPSLNIESRNRTEPIFGTYSSLESRRRLVLWNIMRFALITKWTRRPFFFFGEWKAKGATSFCTEIHLFTMSSWLHFPQITKLVVFSFLKVLNPNFYVANALIKTDAFHPMSVQTPMWKLYLEPHCPLALRRGRPVMSAAQPASAGSCSRRAPNCWQTPRRRTSEQLTGASFQPNHKCTREDSKPVFYFRDRHDQNSYFQHPAKTSAC